MATAQRADDRWQIDKSLVECTQHVLQHPIIYSDVIFKLDAKQGQDGGEAVYIHAVQALLLIRSPVFFSMFTGGLAGHTEQPPVIDIPDIEPEAFKEMLRYIYTDTVHLTTSNVMGVMYAAKKYLVTKLSKACTQFLEENLSADTALTLLDQSLLFEEKDLKEKVLDTITEEAPVVLSSEDFPKISGEALHEVLQLNMKISKEREVFEATLKWAENKCLELKKPSDGPNRREALGDNLSLVRFPTMSVDDLNDSVLPSNVLLPTESLQLFQYITAKSNKPTTLPFPTQPRNSQTQSGSDTASCVLNVPTSFSASGMPAQCIPTRLQCHIQKSMQITKIRLNKPEIPEGLNQTFTVELTQNGKLLYSHETSEDEDHMLDVFVEIGAELILEINWSVSGPRTRGAHPSMPSWGMLGPPSGGLRPSMPSGGLRPSMPSGGLRPSMPSGGMDRWPSRGGYPSVPSGGARPSMPSGTVIMPYFQGNPSVSDEYITITSESRRINFLKSIEYSPVNQI